MRTLPVQCEFGTILNTVLRDIFVLGLEKGTACDKIFLESLSLIFERAMEIANNAEYIQNQYEVEVKSVNDINSIQSSRSIMHDVK